MKQKQKICCNIVTFAADFQDYKQTMGVPGKKRIEFIDLAKGVCILLIILGRYLPQFTAQKEFIKEK